MHVYLTRPLSDAVMEQARDSVPAELVVYPEEEFPPSRERLLSDVRGARGLISMVTDRIDREVLEAAGPQLEIVANVAVGFDNIDLDAAKEHGVVVTNTPGVLDEATADLAFALLLAVTRRLAEGDRFICSGEEWIWGPRSYVGLDVSADVKLGIVGLGRIGMAVARRARAFGMEILATGRRAFSEEAQELGVRPADLEEVIAEADVVSLHCPLTNENRHMIGRRQLDAMKPGSYLINTARGPLVDEEALADALEQGSLAGAGLDVHEFEPEVNPRLRQIENAVLLPHIGSAGDVTRDRMGGLAVRNVAEVLSGRAPVTPVR